MGVIARPPGAAALGDIEHMNAGRYFHALRHLRPAPLRHTPEHRWPLPPIRRPSMPGSDRCGFMGLERELRGAAGWNVSDVEKLWLYNLHYFATLLTSVIPA